MSLFHKTRATEFSADTRMRLVINTVHGCHPMTLKSHLGLEKQYPRPRNCTKCYKFFINHALLKYQ